MREITVPSSAVALRSDKPLTPAMVSAIWELASALDAARIPAEVDNSVWLEVPSRLLRGEDGRSDNVWLRECLEGRRDRDELVQAIEHSELRGLGGAGFRSGHKWRLVRQEPAPRLMAINADEGEPGTFKDRTIIRNDPYQVIEGALIAALAVGADNVVFGLKASFGPELGRMRAAIAEFGIDSQADGPQTTLTATGGVC